MRQNNNMITRIILWTVVISMCHADHRRPSVATKLGLILGLRIEAEFKGCEYTTNRYAGLRYAKPPIGELRFQMPVPYGKYESPFDATDFTSACPQHDMAKLGTNSVDEDCLSLSVYVPTTNSEARAGHAVMIFVHGGGFVVGGANLYPAEVLSAVGNVIVVVINYRLGLLGFANTGDGQIRGNLGLWDQRLAFQWVQDNIESFGGDPSRVTIFGESAGAFSVALHAMYPQNKGLFHNVIAESGAPTQPVLTGKDNLQLLTIVAENLGCSTGTTAAVVECLKEVETPELISTLTRLFPSFVTQPFVPTIDGVLIKRPPLETFLEARQRSIEEIEFLRSINLITGVTNAEGALLLTLLGDVDLETVVVSYDDMERVYIPLVVSRFYNRNPESVPEAVLSVVAAEYTDYSDLSNAREMFVKLFGDVFFNVACQELSSIHSNSSASKTWAYIFEAPVEQHPIATPSWVKGANHVDEIPAVFGYGFSELGFADYSSVIPAPFELDLSERIMTYWSNFAKYSDPNGRNGFHTKEDMMWPEMDLDSGRFIRFNKEDTVGRHYLAREVNFWRNVVPIVWNSIEHPCTE